MRTWTTGRIGALAGVGFIVLTVIGDVAAGSPPSTDDSATTIGSFFHDHHRAVVTGAILTGIAAPLFLGQVTALALRLRAAGPGLAAAAFFALATAGVALGVVADALYGALARIGEENNNALAKGVYEIDGFVTGKSFWFAAGAILAAAWGGRRVLPRWYALLSVPASVVVALGGVSLRVKGFFAPLGGMTGIAFIGLLVWVLATCLVLWREPAAATMPP